MRAGTSPRCACKEFYDRCGFVGYTVRTTARQGRSEIMMFANILFILLVGLLITGLVFLAKRK
ncbi:hypothetical protein [Geothermobacter hydrogeniphilus]|uniref:hypothetical protein n=1 Tax=Geothermobacter hydrogeniphilus TaxID=1969733 RepID=UPI0011AF6694|nr:hypothetical protein [Geothermobacter hydrogeniphilus]